MFDIVDYRVLHVIDSGDQRLSISAVFVVDVKITETNVFQRGAHASGADLDKMCGILAGATAEVCGRLQDLEACVRETLKTLEEESGVGVDATEELVCAVADHIHRIRHQSELIRPFVADILAISKDKNEFDPHAVVSTAKTLHRLYDDMWKRIVPSGAAAFLLWLFSFAEYFIAVPKSARGFDKNWRVLFDAWLNDAVVACQEQYRGKEDMYKIRRYGYPHIQRRLRSCGDTCTPRDSPVVSNPCEQCDAPHISDAPSHSVTLCHICQKKMCINMLPCIYATDDGTTPHEIDLRDETFYVDIVQPQFTQVKRDEIVPAMPFHPRVPLRDMHFDELCVGDSDPLLRFRPRPDTDTLLDTSQIRLAFTMHVSMTFDPDIAFTTYLELEEKRARVRSPTSLSPIELFRVCFEIRRLEMCLHMYTETVEEVKTFNGRRCKTLPFMFVETNRARTQRLLRESGGCIIHRLPYVVPSFSVLGIPPDGWIRFLHKEMRGEITVSSTTACFTSYGSIIRGVPIARGIRDLVDATHKQVFVLVEELTANALTLTQECAWRILAPRPILQFSSKTDETRDLGIPCLVPVDEQLEQFRVRFRYTDDMDPSHRYLLTLFDKPHSNPYYSCDKKLVVDARTDCVVNVRIRLVYVSPDATLLISHATSSMTPMITAISVRDMLEGMYDDIYGSDGRLKVTPRVYKEHRDLETITSRARAISLHTVL